MPAPQKSRRRKPPADASRKRRSVHKDVAAAIDYKNPESLRQFLTERGKIKGRRMTGLSRRDQSLLARQVKRARELALLPYVAPAGAGERSERRGRGGPRER
ncbi:30S ribosomal protein S18 [Conexibacter sp. CPCC 206217]|uniref:30S ribosomal protein S18 n=1 Tax=Conexibacter sp. CPCC 206217 TaxID=3064574 RepID=UPI00271B9391|nr:30S ribosomal protein S18 [Conexibacter sp. CPCC 206217]MDO8210867.1 30S ribosomal protein S18 [Conexibacter sp. CPCC 206217]